MERYRRRTRTVNWKPFGGFEFRIDLPSPSLLATL